MSYTDTLAVQKEKALQERFLPLIVQSIIKFYLYLVSIFVSCLFHVLSPLSNYFLSKKDILTKASKRTFSLSSTSTALDSSAFLSKGDSSNPAKGLQGSKAKKKAAFSTKLWQVLLSWYDGASPLVGAAKLEK